MGKVNIRKYIEQIKKIQVSVLAFLETNEKDDFLELIDIIKKTKILQNRHKFKSFLYLLSKISANHHRELYFFEKIEKIIQNFKEDIKKNYSNTVIFNIFKTNKRILLFLLEEQIIIMDECITRKIMCKKYFLRKYPQYFWPEIQKFKDEKWFKEYIKMSNVIKPSEFFDEINQMPEDFSEKRKIGENLDFICEKIRNDSVEEFIAYINRNKFSVNSKINNLAIYETNSFLLKNKKTSFIEYAAFFGSIQILRYLLFSRAKLPPSLWLYAIHGKNPEIIHILEENNVVLPKNKNDTNQNIHKFILIESIKCHHNDIAKYFQDKEEEESIDSLINNNGLKYYNFAFVQKKLINESLFYYFCKYDYYLLVNIILITLKIDINNPIIRLFKF